MKYTEFIEQVRGQYIKDLKAVLDTPGGIRLLGRILDGMGLFKDVYASNATIHKNAALADHARRITQDMDSINMQYLVKIKEFLLEEAVRGKEITEETDVKR